MSALQKVIYNTITPLLCALSLSTATIDGQCYNSCEPSPPCADWCSILVPVLAGAAAGAATGAAVNKRGKKGSQGHRGPRGNDGQDGQDGLDGIDGRNGKNGHDGCKGPRGRSGKDGKRGPRGPRGHQGEPGAPWVADIGQELTFNFALALSQALSAGGPDIIPFVEMPDGRIIEGTHFSAETTANQTTSVTIANPIYGTYHFGYVIPPHLSPAIATISNSVSTSRDSTTTTFPTTMLTLAATATNLQYTDDYTYFLNDN